MYVIKMLFIGCISMLMLLILMECNLILVNIYFILLFFFKWIIKNGKYKIRYSNDKWVWL